MSLILLFVDGLGLGKNDPESNPCSRNGIQYLAHFKNSTGPVPIVKNGYCIPTDATLGIAGLPQSGTGQSTLLTGINCCKRLGRHLQGYPNENLRNILRKHSILKQLRDMGFRTVFINTYRPLFFQLKEKTRWHLSTTTVATLAAGLDFFNIKDLLAKRSLYHDFTNLALISRGFDVPLTTPEEAGEILINASLEYHFILYEYFLTDRAGHSQNRELAYQEISKLDRFLHAMLNKVDLDNNIILLTSDHGNIEDLSVKTHTKNQVMTLIWGEQNEWMANQIKSLADISPVIINYLKSTREKE